MRQRIGLNLHTQTRLWMGYISTCHEGEVSVTASAVDPEFDAITADLLRAPSTLFRARATLPSIFDTTLARNARVVLTDETRVALIAHLEALQSSAQNVTLVMQYASILSAILRENFRSDVGAHTAESVAVQLRANMATLRNDRLFRRQLRRFLDEVSMSRISCDRLAEVILDVDWEVDQPRSPPMISAVLLSRLFSIATQPSTLLRIVKVMTERLEAGTLKHQTNRFHAGIRVKLHQSVIAVDVIVAMIPLLTALFSEPTMDKDLLLAFARALKRSSRRGMREFETLPAARELAKVIVCRPVALEADASLRIPFILLLDGVDVPLEVMVETLEGLARNPAPWAINQTCSQACRFFRLAHEARVPDEVIVRAVRQLGLAIAEKGEPAAICAFFGWYQRSRHHVPCPEATRAIVQKLPQLNEIRSSELLAVVLSVIDEVPDSNALANRISTALAILPLPPPPLYVRLVEAYISVHRMGAHSRRLSKRIREIFNVMATDPSAIAERDQDRIARKFPRLYRLNARCLAENRLYVHVAKASSGAIAQYFESRGHAPTNEQDFSTPLTRRRVRIAIAAYTTIATHFVPGRLTHKRLASIMVFLSAHRKFWREGQLVVFAQTLCSVMQKLSRLRVAPGVERRHGVAMRPLLTLFVEVAAEAIRSDAVAKLECKVPFAHMAAQLASSPTVVQHASAATRANIRLILDHILEVTPSLKDDLPKNLLNSMLAAAAEINDVSLRLRLSELAADGVDGLNFKQLVQLANIIDTSLDVRARLQHDLSRVE